MSDDQDRTEKKERRSRALDLGRRILDDAFETGLILITVGILAFSTAAITLHGRTISLNFMKDTLENALSVPGRNLNVSMENLTISWPELTKPFVFSAETVRVKYGADAPFLAIEDAQISLSFIDLLGWDAVLTKIRLNKPSLRLIHTGEGRFTFSLGQEPLGDQETTQDKPSILALLFNVLAGQTDAIPNAYKKLRDLSLLNADLELVDFESGRILEADPVNIDLRRSDAGVEGEVFANLPDHYGENAVITVLAEYYRGSKESYVQLSASNIIYAPILKEWTDFQPSDAYDDPISIVVEGLFKEHQPADLDYELFMPGKDLIAYGRILGQEKDRVTLSAQVPSLKADDLDALWPGRDKESLPRLWLVEKMSNGTFKNARSKIDFLYEDKAWTPDFESAQARFEFENLDVVYKDGLAPSMNSFGRGNVDGRAMDLYIEKANISGITLRETARLEFTDLVTKGAGEAIMNLKLSSSIANLYTYLNGGVLTLDKYVDLDLEHAKGQATTDVTLTFPTIGDLSAEMIDVDVTSVFENTNLPNVYKNLDLTGGPFTVEATKEHFSLKGAGQLDSYPIQLVWRQSLKENENYPYKTYVEAELQVTPALQKALNVDVEDFVTGSFPAIVAYEENLSGQRYLDLEASFDNAALHIAQLSYMKPRGQKADLAFSATLNNNTLKSIRALNLEGYQANIKGGNITLGPNGFPQKASFERFQLGRSNAKLNITEENGYRFISIEGDSFDGGGLLSGGSGSRTLPAIALDVDVDTLYMKNDRALEDVDLAFRQSPEKGIEEISLNSKIKNAPLTLEFHPYDEGVIDTLVLKADNAGATLAALGLFDTMRGGKINYVAQPLKDRNFPQEVGGRLYITDFRIVDTPFLARLLNAMSLMGPFQLLTDDGLRFDSLKGDAFTRKNANGDWLVMFDDAKTSGSTLGITFDGRTNITQKTMNIGGTIVPVSGVNNVVSKVPIIGPLVAGGEDSALFAARFTMKGSDKDPKVSFNPISLLTPGFIRDIFFDSDIDMSVDVVDPKPEKKPEDPEAEQYYDNKPRYNQ